MSKLLLCENNFVRLDGVLICRITNEGDLEFYDKDKRRSEERGTPYVTISLDDFIPLVIEVKHTNRT